MCRCRQLCDGEPMMLTCCVEVGDLAALAPLDERDLQRSAPCWTRRSCGPEQLPGRDVVDELA